MRTRTKQQPFLMRAATTALALAQATRRATAALAIILLTAQTAWADSTFSGGDGSQGNPYKIANETDLRQLATDVNGGNSYSGKFFQQSQNITLTQNFTSIGCYKSNKQGGSKSFSGTYDGGNKTISGLTINGSTTMQGLFGRVENATIQNLTLSGASVTNSASYVGAFVGWSNGGLTMINCHAVNCNVSAPNNSSVAIFVGSLYNPASTIKSCTVSGGSVSGNNDVGAIVGYAYGSSNDHAIVGCVARGVTGGDNLIGTNTGSCVSNVASYGNNDYTITAGTGVTITYSAVSNTYSDIIHPPYIKAGETVPVTLSYTGSLSNVTYRATGATLNDEGTQLSNAQGNVTITATEATKTDISGGSIADIAWQTWTGSALTPALTVTVGGKTLTAGTDYLVNYTDNTHIGTATATVTGTGAYKGTLTKTFEIRYSGLPYNSTGNFYEIGNETALRALSSYVGSGGETSGRTFKQTEDITLTSSFSPIGISSYYEFHGIYDGNNKTIGGLSVSGNVEYAALFGYMFGGTVKNVILISPSVSSSYKHTIGNAGARVSALVGSMNADAIIDNCIVINPTLSATGQGNNYVGIFIGESGSRCSISNCYYYDGNTEHNYAAYEYDDYISATNILRVYSVNASGCTATATPTISVGGTDYYKEGTTVTLSLSGGTAPEGYLFGGYTVNGTAIDGNTFTIGSKDAAIATTITPDPAQFSQSGDTYTIHTAGGWNVFCDLLESGESFSGKTVRLGDDITVTRMAGGDGHEFTGTFDGGGHTLTVNYANTDNNIRTAPFSYVDGATIQNLIVGGTISGDHYRAAGIIGETGNTTSHITNCVSSVDISSGRYTGGFSIGGNVEIEGCVFNGKIKGTTYSGGFIGYSYSAQVIKNSLFAPQDGSSISGGTFYYNGGGDVAPVNSYYTQALGTAQGKACHSVTAGTDVTIGAIALTGTATQYTVSGITAYSGGGLQRGQTLYYGIDDQLSLTLTTSTQCDQPGYQYAYTASPDGATLTGSANPYTLTMPDADVTVSVMWTAETYTINYNLDGGHLPTGQSNPATYTVETETFTLVNPERNGYAFAGWTGTGLNSATETVTITQGSTTGNRDYTATWTLLPVSYIDADGNEQTLQPDEFTVLTGGGTTTLSPGWYVVNSDITYTSTVRLGGAVTIILCNGCTMSIGTEDKPLTLDDVECIEEEIPSYYDYENEYYVYATIKEAQGHAIGHWDDANSSALTIYGQTLDNATAGNLDIHTNGYYLCGILTKSAYVQNSGNVNIYSEGSDAEALFSNNTITINGGKLNATSVSSHAIYPYYGDVNINGGKVDAMGGYEGIQSMGGRINLNWTNADDYIHANSYTWGGSNGGVFIADGKGFTTDGTDIYSGALSSDEKNAIGGKTLRPAVILADDASNATAISDAVTACTGSKTLPVQLKDRTLYKDGSWNTLCLPFDVTIADSPLAGDGVDVRTLAGSDFSNGTLTLDFTDKDAVTTLKAGKPYIIRWASKESPAENLVNPVFNGVTVSTATANVETDCVDFIGILSPTVLYEDGAEKTNLYMGADNKLYYPTVEGFKLNACRGYFKLKGISVNGNGNDNGNENAIRSFDINFGEETTGVALMDNGKLIIDNEAGAWYDLSGRKLSVSSDSSVPSVLPKGVYIHNGHKVVVQ